MAPHGFPVLDDALLWLRMASLCLMLRFVVLYSITQWFPMSFAVCCMTVLRLNAFTNSFADIRQLWVLLQGFMASHGFPVVINESCGSIYTFTNGFLTIGGAEGPVHARTGRKGGVPTKRQVKYLYA